ncbi:MAG: (d)CMP kinase [Clostridiales bacterium]|nr:(d)CMP kinase [Clostridiales bacterium]
MKDCIAVDGPAGAGKSTIARKVAERLGIIYVDTGAMYRAMGLYFHNLGIDSQDQEGIAGAVDQAEISIEYRDGEQQVILNGENVNGLIRTNEAGNLASAYSKYTPVRKKLVELQQQLAARTPVIMDGRDIGTVVLPDAMLKVYLTASVEIRAKRRYLEYKQKNVETTLEKVEEEVRTRDDQDMHREVSPLMRAEDALLLDASDMTVEQVVDVFVKWYQERKVQQEEGTWK